MADLYPKFKYSCSSRTSVSVYAEIVVAKVQNVVLFDT